MKYSAVIFFILCLFFGCTIKGSFQGLYSYYNKTRTSQPGLFASDSAICELENQVAPKVYIIKGIDLAKCLKEQEKAFVYIWAPKCKSKYCYPINFIQQKADSSGAELFIVAEYFDSELMNIRYNIERPIFGPDIEYYKSNKTAKYLPELLADIGVPKMNISNGRILLFENGSFVSSFSYLGDLK